MTKEETTKVLTILASYYPIKIDANAMLIAWHEILKDYNYNSAIKAVKEFARNDVRDYATFPTVGKVIQMLKEVEKPNNALIRELQNELICSTRYENISKTLLAIITKEEYNELMELKVAKRNEKIKQLVEIRKELVVC